MRYIEVKKCGPENCPYCMPDPFRSTINHCYALYTTPTLNSKIKTFPKFCPLDKLKSK